MHETLDENLLSEDFSSVSESRKPSKSEVQYMLFFMLGNASLLCFNIIINAIDIYQNITKNNSVGDRLSQAYNIPCSLTALALCIIKIRNLKLVLIIALSILTAILCIIPVLLLASTNPDIIYYGTLILTGLSGIVSSIIFSNAYSIASQFVPESGAAVSSGEGCCGVLAAVMRIITKAAFSSGPYLIYSSACYFFLAAAFVLATLIYFIRLSSKPEISAKIQNNNEQADKLFTPDMKNAIKEIWPLWLSCLLVFCVTLTIFPGYVTAGIQGPLKSWMPVIVTSVFCVFDWLGRWLPAVGMWPSPKYLWIPVVLRLLFFPIEIVSLQGFLKLGEPWYTAVMMLPFALSNGYFGTAAIIYGSNAEQLTAPQKRYAGLLMSFAVNAGIILAMGFIEIMPKPITDVVA